MQKVRSEAFNVSEKKRLVRHSTALVQCTAWQRKEINCTRAVHKKYHHTRRFHELVGNPRQPRPSIFQSYFLRSFVRSFVIAIPWRHRIVFSPVVAVSHRRSHISGMHPDTKRHSNSFEDTSLRFSRTQSSEHARLSSSPPNPQPFVRVVAENSQKCVKLFFSWFQRKGTPGKDVWLGRDGRRKP